MSGLKKSCFSASPARIPATKQPETLIINVLRGNFQSAVGCNIRPPSLYRDMAPMAPPIPTVMIFFIWKSPFECGSSCKKADKNEPYTLQTVSIIAL